MDEIATHEGTIEQLQDKIEHIQNEHRQVIMNKENEHHKALEVKEVKHNEEINFLNSIYMKARKWFPDLADLFKTKKERSEIDTSSSKFTTLLDYKEHHINGVLFSPKHRRKFKLNNTPIQIVRDTDNRLKLHINHKPLKQWF